jgi:hypothetical protein
LILLVANSVRAQECAEAIERKTHDKVTTAGTVTKAIASLERAEFEVLVLDELMMQMNNSAEPTILAHAGIAVPMYVNLALHGAERVAGEVSLGLQRAAQEWAASMRAASSELRNQLGSDVTAILLNAELGLQEKSLSPGVSQKLGMVQAIAQNMRQKLDGKLVEETSSKVARRRSTADLHG